MSPIAFGRLNRGSWRKVVVAVRCRAPIAHHRVRPDRRAWRSANGAHGRPIALTSHAPPTIVIVAVAMSPSSAAQQNGSPRRSPRQMIVEVAALRHLAQRPEARRVRADQRKAPSGRGFRCVDRGNRRGAAQPARRAPSRRVTSANSRAGIEPNRTSPPSACHRPGSPPAPCRSTRCPSAWPASG